MPIYRDFAEPSDGETYVFTDTIEKAIDTLLPDAYAGSDAVVSAQDLVELPAGGRPTVPAELLPR